MDYNKNFYYICTITKQIITMTKLRAAATITLYVYGENEQELINEANLAVKAMNLADDCNATLTDLQTINFGKLEAKKIDFNKKTRK